MGFSVFIVFLVITTIKRITMWQTANNSTIKETTTAPIAPSTTPAPLFHGSDTWIYVAIVVSVVLFVVGCQSLFFYLYIRKLKKSEPPRNINTTAFLQRNENSEDRYQRAPSRLIANSIKSAEQRHSSSLYGYECVKDIKDKKPTPPPTSTLPKRERPPLPLPSDAQGPKWSTLTPNLTQQLLQERGRQVSTVPNRPPMNFNAQAPIPSRSPQKWRPSTPVRTPVLKPRGTPKSETHKLYESLPDLREKLQPKPTTVQPQGALMQPKPATPDLRKVRQLPGTKTASPSPILPPKGRMPLPQENNRNEDFKPPAVAPPPVFTPATPYILGDKAPKASSSKPSTAHGPGSISNELMEKLKRRQALISQNTSTGSAKFTKPPIFPPSRVNPTPIDDESSDEEWTLEEINQINMYNV